MTNLFRKLAEIVWPATGFWVAEKALKHQVTSLYNTWEKEYENLFRKLSHVNERQLRIFLDRANQLYESEFNRKRVFESKALALLGTVGLSFAILTLVVTALDKILALPSLSTCLILGFLVLGAIYFLLSGIFALQTVKAVGIHQDTTKDLRETIDNVKQRDPGIDQIVSRILLTDLFYRANWRKNNYSSTAQGFFIRGIIFLFCATLVFIVTIISCPNPL